jgi:putative peptidoglycan lipid II flippase
LSISKEKKNSIVSSVGVVSSATAFSRVLGLLREQVMAYFFGASMATDAFLAAFRIPNLLRDMFAEGALSSAFVPVFKEKMIEDGDEEAFRLGDIVITGILVVVGIIVLLGIIAAPVIVYLTANGFTANPIKFDLTVSLSRLMMVYLLLVSLSALVMGMLNSYGRFGIPAVAPAMFNLGIIATVLLLYKYFDQPVYSLALGVLIGGLGQLIVQLPALLKIGFRFKLSFQFLDEGFKKVVNLLMPMIIGLSASRINIILNTLIASFLMEGSLSFLNYSYRLMHFPLGVFAVALGTVALPKVTELVTRKDSDGLKQTFEETLNLNMLVIIPSALFLAAMGREVVDLVYGWGKFTYNDAGNTTLALLHYSYGLIGFAAVRVTVPFYYAHQDSRLPMRASLISVVVNILLYYPLVKILSFAGLAAATSIAGLLNFFILLYYLPNRGVMFSYKRIILNFIQISIAALLSFYSAKFIPFNIVHGDYELLFRLKTVVYPSAIAVIIFIAIAIIFDFPMARALLKKLTKVGK